MMPIAIEHGITVDEFERRTFKEINMIIEARLRVHEREMKSNLMKDYQMVDLIAASVGRLMSEEVTYPQIYEIYPTIFGEELRESARKEKERHEALQVAAQWKQFAKRHNATLKKDEV